MLGQLPGSPHEAAPRDAGQRAADAHAADAELRDLCSDRSPGAPTK